MNTTKEMTAGSRRTRYAFQTGVLVLAVTAICAFGVFIASRAGARIDVTATRDHMLSEQTTRVLSGLKKPYEIIVTAGLSGADPKAAQRTIDVLDAIQDRSPLLTLTTIDTSRASGLAEFDRLLSRLTDRFGTQIASIAGELKVAGEQASELAKSLDDPATEADLHASLVALQADMNGQDGNTQSIKRDLQTLAAQVRLNAEQVRNASKQTSDLLGQKVLGLAIAPTDQINATLRPAVDQAATNLSIATRFLDRIIAAGVLDDAHQDRARQTLRQCVSTRDISARLTAKLDAIPESTLLRVVRAIERTSAVIVLGPPDEPGANLAALDTSSLFPPATRNATAGSTPDTRHRTEDLVLAAIGSILEPNPPIVVVVHGEGRVFGENMMFMKQTIDRMLLQNIDVVEWPAAMSPEPPSLATLNPGGKRPVVYVTLATDGSTVDGAPRMLRLAQVIEKLVKDGKSVLLSLAPSTLPAIGESDPMVSYLEPLGIRVDTSRPVLRQVSTPAGRVVTADHYFTTGVGDAPLAQVLSGVRSYLRWPIPVHSEVTSGAASNSDMFALTPLISIKDDDATWAEAEWLGFFQVPPAQRGLVTNPPTESTSRDDGVGPWTIAAAATRRLPGAARQQRLVIVASNGWFFDAITTQSSTQVAGRGVPDFPGNAELFHASVSWLAGMDHRIARSAQAMQVPTIRQISASERAAMRWGLWLGMPCLILLSGITLRLMRG